MIVKVDSKEDAARQLLSAGQGIGIPVKMGLDMRGSGSNAIPALRTEQILPRLMVHQGGANRCGRYSEGFGERFVTVYELVVDI